MSDGPILQLITSRGPKLQLTQRCEGRGPILHMIQLSAKSAIADKILLFFIVYQAGACTGGGKRAKCPP